MLIDMHNELGWTAEDEYVDFVNYAQSTILECIGKQKGESRKPDKMSIRDPWAKYTAGVSLRYFRCLLSIPAKQAYV